MQFCAISFVSRALSLFNIHQISPNSTLFFDGASECVCVCVCSFQTDFIWLCRNYSYSRSSSCVIYIQDLFSTFFFYCVCLLFCLSCRFKILSVLWPMIHFIRFVSMLFLANFYSFFVCLLHWLKFRIKIYFNNLISFESISKMAKYMKHRQVKRAEEREGGSERTVRSTVNLTK